MLRDDGAAMSAYERKADLKSVATEIRIANVRFRAVSGPRGAVRLMSADSQKRTFDSCRRTPEAVLESIRKRWISLS